MTINLTEGRPTVRLSDRWEETRDLSTEPKGGNRQHSTRGGRSRCVNPERKEDAEGKPTEGRRKQRRKVRNLRIPNDRNRKERIKIKQSPAVTCAHVPVTVH